MLYLQTEVLVKVQCLFRHESLMTCEGGRRKGKAAPTRYVLWRNCWTLPSTIKFLFQGSREFMQHCACAIVPMHCRILLQVLVKS